MYPFVKRLCIEIIQVRCVCSSKLLALGKAFCVVSLGMNLHCSSGIFIVSLIVGFGSNFDMFSRFLFRDAFRLSEISLYRYNF
ncbi:hypothetical protein L6452_13716 [Arctium lappa]|uniref:Uncharacterized protein n=1 Tax=Arctium lappa TaxID=4217 RepID=A0ACB9CIY3_ARCLA|nr:hypothetical protein L6452_13716 [Arctium lappa]